MMVIIRSAGAAPNGPAIAVKAIRKTPELVADGAGKTDYFCAGDAEALAALRAEGWDVVELRDGWYDDGTGGGVAISGHGKYWEVRDTPFTVKEAVGPGGKTPGSGEAGGDLVNVRRAIFGV